MRSEISFVLDGRIETIDFTKSTSPTPTTTVLNYLRSLPSHKGVKEGCAEGDCGACTVVLGQLGENDSIRYKSVDSCLVFLPMIHGKQLVTVENLKRASGELHPVQEAMVESGGSQCGFCTPGIVMSLFALYKNSDHPSRHEIDDALTGNLCRCTGYRPIIEAASEACVHNGIDELTANEHGVAEMLKTISSDPIEIETEFQKYFKPASGKEAGALVAGHPKAVIISGATDIALRVTKKHELIPEIIDISDVQDFKTIVYGESSVSIGAGVTFSDAMPVLEKEFPALVEMLSIFGSRQIRNLATFGGNLGTASPIGDTLPVLTAYGAKVVLESQNGKRELPLDDYFIGYRKTARRPDELITSVVVPKQSNGSKIRSYKISKRKDLDISTLSGGFRLCVDGAGCVKEVVLAYGGMAERTKRASAVEMFLIGKPWKRETVEGAMPLIEKDFTPISDARASAEYRRVAAKNLLLKFWTETASHES